MLLVKARSRTSSDVAECHIPMQPRPRAETLVGARPVGSSTADVAGPHVPGRAIPAGAGGGPAPDAPVVGPARSPRTPGDRLGQGALSAGAGRGWLHARCPAAQGRPVAGARRAPAGGTECCTAARGAPGPVQPSASPDNDAAQKIGRDQAQQVSQACNRKIIRLPDYKTGGAIRRIYPSECHST
jgi:hypothetical protein